ncbi:MAG: hypothetical protein WBS18_00130 [Candidatus Acidiferrales bacterium]
MPANLFPVLWNSARATLRACWRIGRQLFHETTGALFILFAAYGAVGAWRQWKTHSTLWIMGFAIIYALLMCAFAFESFRRARRIR